MYDEEMKSCAGEFWVNGNIHIVIKGRQKPIATDLSGRQYSLELTRDSSAVLCYGLYEEKLYRLDLESGKLQFIAECSAYNETEINANSDGTIFYLYPKNSRTKLMYADLNVQGMLFEDVYSYFVDSRNDRLIVLLQKGYTKYDEMTGGWGGMVDFRKKGRYGIGCYDNQKKKRCMIARDIKSFVLSEDNDRGYFLKYDGIYYFDLNDFTEPKRVYSVKNESRVQLKAMDKDGSLYFCQDDVYCLGKLNDTGFGVKILFVSEKDMRFVMAENENSIYMTCYEKEEVDFRSAIIDDCFNHDNPKLDKLRTIMRERKGCLWQERLYYFDGSLRKTAEDIDEITTGNNPKVHNYSTFYNDLAKTVYRFDGAYEGCPIIAVKRQGKQVRLSEIRKYLNRHSKELEENIYEYELFEDEESYHIRTFEEEFRQAWEEIQKDNQILDLYVCQNGRKTLLLKEMIPANIRLPSKFDDDADGEIQTDTYNGIIYLIDSKSKKPNRIFYEIPLIGKVRVVEDWVSVFSIYPNGEGVFVKTDEENERNLPDRERNTEFTEEETIYYVKCESGKYILAANHNGEETVITDKIADERDFFVFSDKEIYYRAGDKLYKTERLSLKEYQVADNVTFVARKIKVNEVYQGWIPTSRAINLTLPLQLADSD